MNQLKLVTAAFVKKFKLTVVNEADCVGDPKIVLRMKNGLRVQVQSR